jgi:hypothetical protein
MSLLPTQVLCPMLPKVRDLVEKRVRLDDNTLNVVLDEKDPDRWWNTFEVNVRGVYNTVRYVFVMIFPQRISS